MQDLIPILYNSVPPVIWFLFAILAVHFIRQAINAFVKETRDNSKLHTEILQELRTKNAVQDAQLENHSDRIGRIEDKVFIVNPKK
jgi:hypothetical protein